MQDGKSMRTRKHRIMLWIHIQQRIRKPKNFVDVIWMNNRKHTKICLDPTQRKRNKKKSGLFFLHFPLKLIAQESFICYSFAPILQSTDQRTSYDFPMFLLQSKGWNPTISTVTISTGIQFLQSKGWKLNSSIHCADTMPEKRSCKPSFHQKL